MHSLGAVEYEEKSKTNRYRSNCSRKYAQQNFYSVAFKKKHIIFANIMDMDKRKQIHQFSGTWKQKFNSDSSCI